MQANGLNKYFNVIFEWIILHCTCLHLIKAMCWKLPLLEVCSFIHDSLIDFITRTLKSISTTFGSQITSSLRTVSSWYLPARWLKTGPQSWVFADTEPIPHCRDRSNDIKYRFGPTPKSLENGKALNKIRNTIPEGWHWSRYWLCFIYKIQRFVHSNLQDSIGQVSGG